MSSLQRSRQGLQSPPKAVSRVTKQIRQSSTTRHPLVRPRAKGLTEGEESVVSFLRAEGKTDSGIEAILDHPGPTGIRASGWTNTVAMRGIRTVTYRDSVYRIESGPEDDFWADLPSDIL